MGERRGVDDGRGDIFGRANARRDGDLGKNRLDLAGHEDIFDQGGDETGFPGAFIAADADAHCSGISGRRQIVGAGLGQDGIWHSPVAMLSQVWQAGWRIMAFPLPGAVGGGKVKKHEG